MQKKPKKKNLIKFPKILIFLKTLYKKKIFFKKKQKTPKKKNFIQCPKILIFSDTLCNKKVFFTKSQKTPKTKKNFFFHTVSENINIFGHPIQKIFFLQKVKNCQKHRKNYFCIVCP